MDAKEMVVGGIYKFKHGDERLVYKGRNWSGNGYWHQFAVEEIPRRVWSELLDTDLHLIEEAAV